MLPDREKEMAAAISMISKAKYLTAISRLSLAPTKHILHVPSDIKISTIT